ncbi:MAG: LbetaH domain-containing protein [Paludibacteraceae bacterium]
MRQVIKNLYNAFAGIVSIFVSFRIVLIINKFVKIVIWCSAKRSFGAIGKESYIEWPFQITGQENMYIGDNFSALSSLRMETFNQYKNQIFSPKLIIGKNVAFNNDCHIGCINRIEIGDNVLGASRIYITDHYHGEISSGDLNVIPVLRPLYSKGPVVIKNNVWIGEGVTILPGVTIGENSIIGANSVVNRDVPANAVVAGVPVKVIKILM